MKNIILSMVLLTLAACGGGGGGGSSSSGFSQTYTASAAAGEVLSYTVDTTNLKYSYTITQSSYGCEVATAACHTGSGTLTKNTDGSYTPSGSPSSKIHALQNGLVVGSILMNLNGTNVTVPIIGVSNPITTTSEIAGTYNFMSLQCNGTSYAFCNTSQGTTTVNASGNYTTCVDDDLSNPNPNCTNTTVGLITPLGGGVWKFQSSNPAISANTNYFLAFKAPNGQKVALVDFNDPVVYGYGQAIMSTQAATTASGNSGNYVYSSNRGTSGLVTVNPNSTTSNGQAITQNAPWNGIATITGGSYGTGYGLLAGNGVYVYRNPTIPGTPSYMEIGLKIN
jgi:hypothetical protein